MIKEFNPATGTWDPILVGVPGPTGPPGPQGNTGADGAQGAPGVGTGGSGIPAGGATGAVLAKTSATNYATAWQAKTVLDVRDYGARGDGATDDSAAFQAAIAAANAAIILNTTLFGTNRRGQVQILIPAGVYRIVTPESLLTGPGVRASGIVFQGVGTDMSNIFFDPASPASEVFLCRNLDAGWLSVRFRQLTFVAANANASFMYSQSAGGPQYYKFDDVGWQGTWKRGVVLEGTNNNSEMVWRNCYVSGLWETFFDLSPSNVSGGDQFVSYEFYSARIWMSAGGFIKATRGGNISVFGGSFIHNDPAATAEQVFFELIGTSHARGVTRLTVEGARFELKHTQSRIVRSGWGDGSVSFTGCDFSSQIANTVLANHVSAEFNNQNVAGPVVSWRDCRLHGQHRYAFHANSFQYAQRVAYDSCTFQAEVPLCLTIAPMTGYGGANSAGAPVIDLRNCRVGEAINSRYNLVDQRFGWNIRTAGAPQTRYCQMVYVNGLLPSQTLQAQGPMVLPLGAVIVGFHGWKPSGTVNASTNFTYTFTNADALSLGVINGDGTTPWTNGFDKHLRDLWIVCDTDNRRTITLTTANITTQAAGHMLIEYLA